jgi:putative Holliday junction resolvase
MKYVGIDYGTKRIGVAVSDETGTLAFPLGTISSGEKALPELLNIVRENGVQKIVIGESRTYAGDANPVMKHIEVFKRQLEERDLEVELEPEFMTSTLAARQFAPPTPSRLRGARDDSRRANPSHEKLDASAAALILQNYLDRIRNSK